MSDTFHGYSLFSLKDVYGSFVKSFKTYPITVRGGPKLDIYFTRASTTKKVNPTGPDWAEQQEDADGSGGQHYCRFIIRIRFKGIVHHKIFLASNLIFCMESRSYGSH